MKEFERFMKELANRKFIGGFAYMSYNYTHEDMLQCWQASRLYYAIEATKDDIEAGRFHVESPEEHMKRLEE